AALPGCLNGAADAREGAAGPPDPSGPGLLPRRPLGSTGVSLPILGLGGFHLGACADEAAARALLETALAEGVTLLDNAESYQDGRAEEWMGAGLAALGARDQVFLMTKTFKPDGRSAESAARDLEASLRRLRTDRLDLWQLHSVQSVEDVDRAFAPGGAMEFIRAQKAAGSVRFTGVTGHANPAANLRALEWWDRGLTFDVMQMPINPLDALQLSFQERVLPELRRRGLGVLAMKTSASGALLREGLCSIDECLRYVWGLPVDVAIVGQETPEQVRQNAALARCAPLDEAGRAALLARLAPRAALSLEWYKKP
ncbi:MAG: aldo/keto reductase, partial [Planctomycetes bacterium]|nr:aldo/keto reductase [Planctomycetota bacterium]